MFCFFYEIIFQPNEKNDNIRNAYVWFYSFHVAVNSHNLETWKHTFWWKSKRTYCWIILQFLMSFNIICFNNFKILRVCIYISLLIVLWSAMRFSLEQNLACIVCVVIQWCWRWNERMRVHVSSGSKGLGTSTNGDVHLCWCGWRTWCRQRRIWQVQFKVRLWPNTKPVKHRNWSFN